MARNGSGTYSKVNTFVAGNTITAAGHNANWDDLASEMTNSVAADGQTTMTGPLKAASGTAPAPGITFASDPDSGIYRVGSNNVGLAVAGAKVLDISATGLDVTGSIKQSGFVLLPVGSVFPYAGTAAPSGYLLCFGQSLLRASYPDLFTAIGTTYGAADGTHFTLPDLRGRMVAGKDNMGGSGAGRLQTANGGLDGTVLGGAGGADVKTLVAGNLPPYTPAGSVSTSSSVASTTTHLNSAVNGGSGAFGTYSASGGTFNAASALGISISSSSSFTGTAQGGTSTPFSVVPPTFILNYIIFAGV